MNSPSNPYLRPRCDADWEPHKDKFKRLYMDEGKSLKAVMEILKSQDYFTPRLVSHIVPYYTRSLTFNSEKQCKNKIKTWGLGKYLKEDDAQKILEGDSSAVPSAYANIAFDEAREKAARALKRKRGREKNQKTKDRDVPLDHSESSEVSDTPSPPSMPPSLGTYSSNTSMTPFSPSSQEAPAPQMDALQVLTPDARFLVVLRKWTNEACVKGYWNNLPSDEHQSGREASRTFAANLTAGIDLYKEGKEDLAWPYWNRAFTTFKEELLKTWYYETPMRLLFELARLSHSAHTDLARSLLNAIASWAEATFTDKTDVRYALFSNYRYIEVDQLFDLYKRAAKCLIDGIAVRMDSDHPLQYEVRLNRALDIMWFEPLADLSEWLPPAHEVDAKLGPTNPYSIYYLLLEAYRLAAMDQYDAMNDILSSVGTRLRVPEAEQKVDPWRVGLAYRRHGRLLHGKGKLPECKNPKARHLEARRCFNQALRYVSSDTKLKASVLIGICHCQLDMAKAIDDSEEVFLWSEMLSQLERQDQQDMLLWKAQLSEMEQTIRKQQGQIETHYSSQMLLPDADGTYRANKRVRMEVSPSRRGTF